MTPDCMLYHSYRLQHINPENYTRRAYIGEISLRQRIRQLQKHCDELQEKRLPLAALVEEAKKLLELEAVPLPTEDYISQILDAKAIKGKETRKKDLLEKLQKLRDNNQLLADLYPIADLLRNLWTEKNRCEALQQIRYLMGLCWAIF